MAVPNYLHREIALAALQAGKHVLCEKPLAMNAAEAAEMLNAAQSAGRVHMTAFTYGFAPAIRYLKHLVESGGLGEIRTVRTAYLMAFFGRLSGWRSSKKLAGSGVLADIGSHLIHLVQRLAGEIQAVSALERRVLNDLDSDVDDWAAFLAEFKSGAWRAHSKSARLCPGRGADVTEQISVEVYGAEGGAVFSSQDPCGLQVSIGDDLKEPARKLRRVPVPEEFLKVPGSPRDVAPAGPAEAPDENLYATDDDPRWSYRYDQAFQFVDSIRRGKSPAPSFEDGLRCQRVLDAVLASSATRSWVGDVAGNGNLHGQILAEAFESKCARAASLAIPKKATACSRLTLGKELRKTSMLSPASRWSSDLDRHSGPLEPKSGGCRSGSGGKWLIL